MTRRDTLSQYAFYAAIFLLPWQTRLIFDTLTISGEPSEYGVLAIYATEVLIAFAYVLRGKMDHAPGERRILQAFYVLMAIGFFSITFTSYPTISWIQMLHLLSASLLLALVLDRQTNLKHLALSFVMGLISPALLGIYQTVVGSSGASTILGLAAKDASVAGVSVVETDSFRMMRAYGSFPHPNIFGGFLAVGLMLLSWLSRFIRERKHFIVLAIPTAVLSIALILTFSRGAWLAVAIGGIALMVQMIHARKIPPSRAVPLVTIGLLTILITLGVFHSAVFARFNPELRVEVISIEERTSQYAEFNQVFFSSTLLGVGPGAYTFALSELDPDQEVWAYQPIHNAGLLLTAELGIAGLLVALRFLFKLFKPVITSSQTSARIFSISIGLSILTIGFFDHYLWSLWPGLALLAIVFGVIARWTAKN
jgi:O-antigen ligase